MTQFTGMEKAEAWRLNEAIKQIEAAIANGVTPRGVSSTLLTHFIDSAKKRIADLERLEETAIAEDRERSLKEVAHAVIAQREAALTAAERRQYEEFLSREAFTREDFGKLEEFYKSAWERLSSDGKAQMSHRIWEGVRREHYQFSELPDIVKEKEAERLHGLLLKSRELAPELQRIPESDRADFLREWEAGNRSKAYEILDRACFADNVALTAKRCGEAAVAVETKTAKKAADMETKESAPASRTSGNAVGTSDISLGDVMLVKNDSGQASKPLIGSPNHNATEVKQR